MSIDDIWAASDYAPTAARLRPVSAVLADRLAELLPTHRDGAAHVLDIGAGHGDTALALGALGHRVTAIEPVARMREVGSTAAPSADWRAATGEDTGLPEESVDAVVSAFGSMFCDPTAGPAEWARVLRPGGALVMSVWNDTGFLAEMTDRMTAVLAPGARTAPPHMTWGREEIARERLAPRFDDVRVEHLTLDWPFESVEDGMRLYLDGSPTHAWSLKVAGERAEDLLAALRGHLVEQADEDGQIRALAGYAVITARRR